MPFYDIKATTKTTEHVGFLQVIQDCIKELNDAISTPSSVDLPSSLSKCIGPLQELDKHTKKIIDKIEKQPTTSSPLDMRTVLELMRPLQIAVGQKERNDLEKKQEWDMKKLYAEVFKISYERNRLRLESEQNELKPIKRGDDQPNFGNAIWWYSCHKANIYYQINTILRLESFELLMSYRYYFSDLCRMIEFMYQKRKHEKEDIEQTFYRAGHINKKQLEKMHKQQKNQFISLLGFISATTDINIAKGYAQKQSASKEKERVLFQIKIKPQEPCTAFAYIDEISFHPEEKEVLFSMGSVFTIDAIIQPENGENFHVVQLTASEIDKTLVDDIRTKVESCTPSGRAVLLAQYLVELGEYRAARKYLNSLLTQSYNGGILMNDPNLAVIYRCLGMTYARQGLHGDALKAFKQALNSQARLEYSDNNAIANIHNSIGSAYVSLGYLDEAEETLAEAVRFQLREVNTNQQDLGSIHSNIGYVHYKKGDYDQAQTSFREAEKIYKQSSRKIAHDALEQSLMKAEHYINYGNLLSKTEYVDEAQQQYKEALRLYKSILQDGDPKLMQTHINIMLAYAQNKKYNEVTKWFEDTTMKKLCDQQEIKIFEPNSSVAHESLAFLHQFVGACYAMQQLFDKAIDLWTRAIIFKHKARLEQLLLETTNSISSALIVEQKTLISEGFDKAREYYAELNEKISGSKDNTANLPSNDFCLGLLYAESYSADKAIKYLTIAAKKVHSTEHDVFYVVYLLLAEMFKYQHEYVKSIDQFDKALQSIKPLANQKDRVLETEVELARSDCLIKNGKNDTAIVDLQKLVESLKIRDNDTKRISLKVIVCDTLARYCLMQKQYDLFNSIAKESMTLKLRSFSQYHPSLAVNFILIAQSHALHSRYGEALDFYEQALEVQSLNLTDNHPKIKQICYAIGDIYCELNKLSNAMEKYDVAENKSLSTDEDGDIQLGKLNSEESVEILTARISMYQHLAKLHERKQNYTGAIIEMNKIINLLKEKLPSSVFETSDGAILIEKNFDTRTVISNLQQLASCYMQLGDIRHLEQEDQNGYEEALAIYLKLLQYDKDLVSSKLTLIYQKLSNYHKELEDDERALEYLQKAAELQKPTIDTLYRLAYLCLACKKLEDAETNYSNILSYEPNDESKAIEKIIKEKLTEVQEEKKKLRRRSSTTSPVSSESYENTSENDVPHSSDKLSRQATNISITSHQRSEANPDLKVDNKVDSSDHRAMANAYFKLGDHDMSIKYYEKDIKKHKNASAPNIFKTQLEKIEQGVHMYDLQNMTPLLPTLLHCVVDKIREPSNLEKSDVLELADSYFKCGILYARTSFFMKSIIAHISAIDIYASKSLINIETLIGGITNVLDGFIERHLKPDEFIEVCKTLMLPDDVIQMRLKIATMYRNNKMDDVEDTDGDGNTNNESRVIALRWYTESYKITENLLNRGVCYYNILRLYKDFIYEDDNGKIVVDDVIVWLPKFNRSDRRLLLSLVSDFLREYDNNKDSCDIKINRQQVQKLMKECFDEKLTENDTVCIGHSLIKLNDRTMAEDYWCAIAEQLEYDISSRVLSLVNDPQSTFYQILQAAKQSETDTDLLFEQLTNTYEIIGDYYMSDAKIGQKTDTEQYTKAESMYKSAAHLLKRLKAKSETITKLEKKQQEAASQAKNLTKSTNK